MEPEVIFILVIIIFSILEGALKGRKKGKGGARVPGPPDREVPRRPGVPRGAETEERTVVFGPGGERPRETADQMVPDEVWEEIAAIARGDVEETLRRRRERGPEVETGRPSSGRYEPAPYRPASPGRRSPPPVQRPREPTRPEPSWPVPVEVSAPPAPEPRRSRTPRSREPRPGTLEREERTVPVLRSAEAVSQVAAVQAAQKADVPLREQARKRAARRPPLTREQQHHRFRGAHALRHAIVAREVLGRPLALREYGEEDLWST